MKIGAKLLLTYFILIGLVAVAALIGVPRLVEAAVVRGEQSNLEQQAQKLAARYEDWLKRRGSLDAIKPQAPQGLGQVPGAAITEETIMVVDPGCIIKAATPPSPGSKRPSMIGRYVPALCTGNPAAGRNAKNRRALTLNLDGIGPVVWATAPLAPDVAALDGWSILLYRDMPFIRAVAAPVTRGIIIAIILGFLAALIIAGWVSREMVNRLQQVGGTAAALAEGDLSQRAPETGGDEITELAHHFNHMAERMQTLIEGLRRSEGARKDLLMMVGHDLRTPMTSIAGFAEALRDGVIQGEEKKRRYYEIIYNESTRLTRLVNDLFDVAKLEAGQLELNLQAMAMAPLLREFAESMRPTAESQQTGIDLEIAPEAETARVYGDRDRLEQVLENLTGNALRYTPAGGVVTLRARVVDDYLLVEVADQGPGLSPEDASQVFERFFQGANQGRSKGGAGLGLAIVKSLVEAHGGQVGVESAPGHGATFWFRLNRLP